MLADNLVRRKIYAHRPYSPSYEISCLCGWLPLVDRMPTCLLLNVVWRLGPSAIKAKEPMIIAFRLNDFCDQG